MRKVPLDSEHSYPRPMCVETTTTADKRLVSLVHARSWTANREPVRMWACVCSSKPCNRDDTAMAAPGDNSGYLSQGDKSTGSRLSPKALAFAPLLVRHQYKSRHNCPFRRTPTRTRISHKRGRRPSTFSTSSTLISKQSTHAPATNVTVTVWIRVRKRHNPSRPSPWV